MITKRSILAIGFVGILMAGCNGNSSKTLSNSERGVIVEAKIPNSVEPVTPRLTESVTPGVTKPVKPRITKTASGNTLFLDLKSGRVEIELQPDLAPNHVKRVTTLAKQGFYDGIVFHRVIDGFMAQTGDPTGTGRGGSELPNLKAEFSPTPFARGVLGMARSSSPDSANSQFFIMLDQGDFLNGKYTVFGKVIKGMEFIDGIKKGNKNDNGAVSNPDKILKMHLAPNS